jgi:hypothetical protein
MLFGWMTMRHLQIMTILMALGFAVLAEANPGPVTFQAYYPLESAALSYELPGRIARAISTVAEWKTLWADIESHSSAEDPASSSGVNALPKIDFNRYTLIVVALGQRPTGGYSVAFHSVRESESQIDVVAHELRPHGKSCIVTTAVTYPVAFALIPVAHKPVHFSIEHADLACGE